jgi:hypothetical protein
MTVVLSIYDDSALIDREGPVLPRDLSLIGKICDF